MLDRRYSLMPPQHQGTFDDILILFLREEKQADQ
jgi:hypothetical protein